MGGGRADDPQASASPSGLQSRVGTARIAEWRTVVWSLRPRSFHDFRPSRSPRLSADLESAREAEQNAPFVNLGDHF
eukprot:15476550-Alexandrium_andersonii.AAC.1